MEDIRTIPISLIVAANDNICPAGDAADLAKRLHTLHNNVIIEGENHYYFYANNSKEYLRRLTDELELPGEGNDGVMDFLFDIFFDNATTLASASAMLTLFTTVTLLSLQ